MEIEEIRKVSLKKDEVVVIWVKDELFKDQHTIHAFMDDLEMTIFPDNNSILLPLSSKMEIVSPEKAEELDAELDNN